MILLSNNDLLGQTEFELDPNQSMIMTGKGPGQDGTINPFAGAELLRDNREYWGKAIFD